MKVFAKYNYGMSVEYTHRQAEGHLLPAIRYLVRGVSNTCLTGHVEIPIVQQRALLLVRVCARSGRGGSAVSRLMFWKPRENLMQKCLGQ